KAAAVAKLMTALAPGAPVRAVVAAGWRPPTAPELTRFEHAPSGRQTPAKRKYVEDRRLREWTRSQPIRTAGLLLLEFPILTREQSFTYQRIAPEAVRLRGLGLTDALAARALGVTDKTIAKAVRWWNTRFGA